MHHIRCGDPRADALAVEVLAGRVSYRDVDAALKGGPASGLLAEFRAALTPPLWVDEERECIGCAALQRTGLLAGRGQAAGAVGADDGPGDASALGDQPVPHGGYPSGGMVPGSEGFARIYWFG